MRIQKDLAIDDRRLEGSVKVDVGVRAMTDRNWAGEERRDRSVQSTESSCKLAVLSTQYRNK